MTEWTAAELHVVGLSLKVAGVAILAGAPVAIAVAWVLARTRLWGRTAC